MKTKSLPAPARRFVLILSALAAAAGLSSCTTSLVDGGYAGHGHGSGSVWGSWEGRGHDSHDRDHGRDHGRGWDAGRDGRDGRRDHGGHGDHGGLAGDGRRGEGSGDMWIGPMPWPEGVRPDRVEPGRSGRFTPREIDPGIAGRLRPEPRGVDLSRFRPDIRLSDPGAIRAGLRPEPRPADVRLSPAAAERLRSVSPGSLRASLTPSPRPSDIRLNPAAAERLRTVTPIPAASLRPASTLRVNPEILRTPRAGTGSLRLLP